MKNQFITPKQEFFARLLLSLWTILCCQVLNGVTIALAQDGNQGLQQATTMVQGYFTTACTLMYAIGAVIGIVGGIKVYQKWNTGEPDTGKVAAAWFGSCIFLVVVATVIKSFFGLS